MPSYCNFLYQDKCNAGHFGFYLLKILSLALAVEGTPT